MDKILFNIGNSKSSLIIREVMTIALGLTFLIISFACSTTVKQQAEPHTSTLIFTPTIEATLSKATEQSCWGTRLLNDTAGVLDGSLVYRTDTGDVLVTDLNSSSTKRMEGKVSLVTTSLDGNVIAQSDSASEKIRFLSQDNNLLISLPEDSYLDIFNAFLSNGYLMIRNRYAPKNNYQYDKGTTDEYYVLSSETGKADLQSVFLPKYWENESRYGASSSFTRYSPDLKYVIYPSYNQFVLYDIGGKNIIWSGWTKQDPSATSLFPPPVWRPDSSAVTIIDNEGSSDNFYDISRDGEIRQLTHFENISNGHVGGIAFPVWSSNGRYLAFRTLRHAGDFLLIFDSETGSIIDPCISLGQEAYYPVWSPGSNQLAFTPIDKQGDVTKVFIVDIAGQLIYLLNEKILSSPIQILSWVNWQIH